MSNRIAVFPGSFDPFTRGHADIALRASMMFERLIIAFGQNSAKRRFFEIELMVSKTAGIFEEVPNIQVMAYEGLTAQFAREQNARYIVRGLRNTTDFEYENSIAEANKSIYPDLETVFLITTPKYAHISSSITREIHKFGQDTSKFLPYDLS